ncbi:MAG: TIM barrel protein [Patescibacteria group bacterium]
MIKYGLKLWTSNDRKMFEAAADGFRRGEFDFIELYFNQDKPVDEASLDLLRSVPVTIHAPNSGAFHEFMLGEEQVAVWRQVAALADRFESQTIVVHPGRNHTVETFFDELRKIDDRRILIENMPGKDLFDQPMFGHLLDDLERIHEKKPICFDFEKATKAAAYQYADYREYITKCLVALTPDYFHISGGKVGDPTEQHDNLWESDMDFPFIKKVLQDNSADKDVRLVFETPKDPSGLDNDLKNMEFFRDI